MNDVTQTHKTKETTNEFVHLNARLKKTQLVFVRKNTKCSMNAARFFEVKSVHLDSDDEICVNPSDENHEAKKKEKKKDKMDLPSQTQFIDCQIGDRHACSHLRLLDTQISFDRFNHETIPNK